MHLHSFCYNLQCILVIVDNVIELSGAYLWAAVITAEDDNFVSCHFEVFMSLSSVKSKIDVGFEIPLASRSLVVCPAFRYRT